MRRLKRQLPGLLVAIVLVGPGYYLRFAYGRQFDALPRWGQAYLQTALTLMGLAMTALLVAVIWARVKERRFRRANAARTVVQALAPGNAADDSILQTQNWPPEPPR